MIFSSCCSSENPIKKGLPNSYGALRQASNLILDDDAVSAALKKLINRLTIVFICWLLSFVLIMSQFITVGFVVGRWTALLFIPMWTGSLVGILSVFSIIRTLLVCENKLSSNEEMTHLQSQGIDLSKAHIGYDSLPLLRRLIFWGFATTIFITLTSTTQVLFYLWLVEGIIGMWHALLPVLLLLLLILVYMIVIKSVTIVDCIAFTLLSLELVFCGMKINNAPAVNWDIVLLPLFCAQLIWVYQLSCICIGCYLKTYLLTSTQILSLSGYIASLMGALAAEAITGTAEARLPSDFPRHIFFHTSTKYDDRYRDQFLYLLLPQLLWMAAVVVAVASFLTILRSEGYRYATCRGHHSPLLLSETNEGWEPVPEGTVFSLLLGSLHIHWQQPSPSSPSPPSPASSPSPPSAASVADHRAAGTSRISPRGGSYHAAAVAGKENTLPHHLAALPQYHPPASNYHGADEIIKLTKTARTLRTKTQTQAQRTPLSLRVSEIAFLPLAKSISGDLEGGKDDF